MYEIVQKKNSLSSLCPAAAAHTLVVVIIIYNNDDDRRHSRATSLENIPASLFSLSNSISHIILLYSPKAYTVKEKNSVSCFLHEIK